MEGAVRMLTQGENVIFGKLVVWNSMAEVQWKNAHDIKVVSLSIYQITREVV